MVDSGRADHRDRLTLLIALEHLGNCTELQLLRFILENTKVNQFNFYLSLADLKDAGCIREVTRLEGTLLVLTQAGRDSISLFEPDVYGSVRERIALAAPAWRRRIQDELQMPADWEEVGGSYVVHLRILEAEEALFSLDIVAADKEQAKLYCSQWKARASLIYRTIIEQLGTPVIKP